MIIMFLILEAQFMQINQFALLILETGVIGAHALVEVKHEQELIQAHAVKLKHLQKVVEEMMEDAS